MNKFLKALGITFMIITLPLSLMMYGIVYGLVLFLGGCDEKDSNNI